MTKSKKPDKQIPELIQQALLAFRENGFKINVSSSRQWVDEWEANISNFDGCTFYFELEVKQHVDRKSTIDILKSAQARLKNDILLVTQYVSEALAEHCRKNKLQFLDVAGNAYIDLPGMHVYITGKPKPIGLKQKSQSAFLPTQVKITYTFLQHPEILTATYREIAKLSNVALGSISPALNSLTEKGFLAGKSKQRRLLNRDKLISEWVSHYQITLRPKLCKGLFSASKPIVGKKADSLASNAWWSGEVAASKLTGYLHPERTIIYLDGLLSPLVKQFHLRADPYGEIEILENFWSKTPRVLQDYPRNIAPPLVVYADLLGTGIDRNVEAAQIIREQFLSNA